MHCSTPGTDLNYFFNAFNDGHTGTFTACSEPELAEFNCMNIRNRSVGVFYHLQGEWFDPNTESDVTEIVESDESDDGFQNVVDIDLGQNSMNVLYSKRPTQIHKIPCSAKKKAKQNKVDTQL